MIANQDDDRYRHARRGPINTYFAKSQIDIKQRLYQLRFKYLRSLSAYINVFATYIFKKIFSV